MPRIAALLLTALACGSVSANPEIHRCPQDDGTVAFQETPCAEPAAEAPSPDIETEQPAASGEDVFDFVNPYDEEAEEFLIEEMPVERELPPPVSRDRGECEKITRDAIDAIDLEMRRGYSPEDGERYKAELLALTRQLRACKQL